MHFYPLLQIRYSTADNQNKIGLALKKKHLNKKGDTTDKRNYRLISTPSTFSKILEKLIFTKINSFKRLPKLSKKPSLKTVILSMAY